MSFLEKYSNQQKGSKNHSKKLAMMVIQELKWLEDKWEAETHQPWKNCDTFCILYPGHRSPTQTFAVQELLHFTKEKNEAFCPFPFHGGINSERTERKERKDLDPTLLGGSRSPGILYAHLEKRLSSAPGIWKY